MAPFASFGIALWATTAVAFSSTSNAVNSRGSGSGSGSGGEQYIHTNESSYRQELLHQCFRRSSRDAFIMSGILAQARRHEHGKGEYQMLEIGCGAGYTTLDLLAKLFPDHVCITAVDTDAKMIAKAQTRLCERYPDKRQQQRITFRKQSGESMAKTMTGQFDAVWLRFVVVHVPDPKALLEAAIRCLKPGGILLVEDTCTPCATTLCHPPIYAHAFFHEMHSRASRKLGGDLTRGAQIGQYMSELGLQQIQLNSFAPVFGHGVAVQPWTCVINDTDDVIADPENKFEVGWKLLELSMTSLICKLRDLEICTEEEIGRAEESIQSFRTDSDTPQVFSLPDGIICQWWATKPRGTE